MTKNTKSLFGRLSDPLSEAILEHDLSEVAAQELIESLVDERHRDLLGSLVVSAPEMLNSERQNLAAFEERNYQRWKEPLDLLSTLWVCCQELAENHSREGLRSSDAVVFDTLAHLVAKALLITSEIRCLLRGGFADGALARWRSLHELAVTAMFIAKHGQTAALGYRMSSWFANSRAAKQYNKYAERSGMKPLDASELSDIEALRLDAQQQLGMTLSSDWDWAAKILKKDRPNFTDLELDVEMDHWRPRYKWACQHVHAGFVHPENLLGMSEAERLIFLVGSSNSGLAEPIHMTAISLMQIVMTFLFYPEPDLDRLVFVRVLQAMTDEIGPSSVRAEAETLAKNAVLKQ